MIVIESYNPAWPSEFGLLQKALQEILGAAALRIDHIGSTSVPGLGAKDVIDIQITVKELSPDIIQRLIDAGYPHRAGITHDHVPLGEEPDPARWEKRYFHQRPGERRAHIHVRIAGNPNQRYPLLFRDYLRAHPNSARSIELIKRTLAKHHGDNADVYYDIKDPVYDLIWEAAQEWAEYSGWSVDV